MTSSEPQAKRNLPARDSRTFWAAMAVATIALLLLCTALVVLAAMYGE